MNLFNMTDLQQELYDLSVEHVGESELEALADDIKTMNAAELRNNIRVFKEADEACKVNQSPCNRRRISSDNCCRHYPDFQD